MSRGERLAQHCDCPQGPVAAADVSPQGAATVTNWKHCKLGQSRLAAQIAAKFFINARGAPVNLPPAAAPIDQCKELACWRAICRRMQFVAWSSAPPRC
jgi:hypothetical protein